MPYRQQVGVSSKIIRFWSSYFEPPQSNGDNVNACEIRPKPPLLRQSLGQAAIQSKSTLGWFQTVLYNAMAFFHGRKGESICLDGRRRSIVMGLYAGHARLRQSHLSRRGREPGREFRTWLDMFLMVSSLVIESKMPR